MKSENNVKSTEKCGKNASGRKTLGIDLGSNSLGWAILDDATADVIDKGVVVFPEGMDLDAGTSLETPAAVRREKRMARRMKFRRKLRKWHLLKLLIQNGMCPLKESDLKEWRERGKYPVENKEFIKWLKATDESNPYCDRNAAAEGKVDPFVLGRALYHICQRRGFKSSRKDEANLIDEETGEVKPADKETSKVKGDISALTEEMATAGCKTLGQYFYKCLEAEKDKKEKKRVRCRYTGRIEHYEKEFRVIMAAQGIKADDKLHESLYKAIFYQRPLRSQAHLVGYCPLETNHRRAQISHPAFEEFRMLAFINNLRFEVVDKDGYDGEVTLVEPTPQDREKICQYVRTKKGPTFKPVLKLFQKDERFKGKEVSFHYYDDADKIPSCPTRISIAEAFGEVEYDEQMVYDAITFYNSDEMLADWFRKHYPALDAKSVAKLVSIHPKEGNANYSLRAIKRILPFLRLGYELSHARFCAKLPKVVKDFEQRKDEILRRLKEMQSECHREKDEYAKLSPSARKIAKQPQTLYERYEDYLLNECNVLEADWKKLYLRGDEQYQPETCYYPHGKKGECVKLKAPRIPPVQLGMIRNPLVQRAMTTLRRLVNYLSEHGKLDTSDTIRIELARSVNDFATRRAWQAWQEKRRKEREEAAMEIAKLGKAATDDAIERYVLWKEQGGKSLYTGNPIKLTELLEGNKYDIEHTVPRSLSGDDSLANKTICEVVYNREIKCGRVPKDCPDWDKIYVLLSPWRTIRDEREKTYSKQLRAAKGVSDPTARCNARIKALTTRFELDYWRDKIRRFEITVDKLTVRDGELGGFKRRQLVDTGIMCSHAVELLKCVYPRTYTVNGAATAFARKAWGLQGDEKKDRTEHTHHAKDAMVIAALTPSRFTAICTALKDDGTTERRECDVCPPPCKGFAEIVRNAANEILVKHVLRQTTLRQSSKQIALAHAHPPKGDPDGKPIKFVRAQGDTVRGALHKDTFYGCIKDPATAKLQKVVRKPLVGQLKDAEALVEKIVDPAIKAIVEEAIAGLKERGVKFIESGMVKMPSGVPINKVRIFAANATNAIELRKHDYASEKDYKTPYYVTSAEGSNFRLAVFNIGGKYSVKADNSLIWAKNHKEQDYVPFDRQEGFVGYVTPGSMALTHEAGNRDELKSLSPQELVKRLYKVVKFRGDGLITLRRHIEARASVVLSKDLKSMGKHASGESKIELMHPHELLLVSPGAYMTQMIFEGIDFDMMLDGTIKFR